MSDEHQLDEQLRERMARLFDAPQPKTLEVAARARALASAWRAEQRARVRRRLIAASGVALSLAASAMLWLGSRPFPGPGSGSKALPPTAASDACRLPRVTAFERDEGRHVLALAELGSLIADADAALTVLGSTPCELRLGLASGTLAGELHALRPARLLIETPAGSIVVTGTRFAVHAGPELEVVLASGTVAVALPQRDALQLSPGHRLVAGRTGAAPAIRPLMAADTQRLDALLSRPVKPALETAGLPEAPAAAVAPAPLVRSPPPRAVPVASRSASAHHEAQGAPATPEPESDLLLAAERARRHGQMETARRLYASAVEREGASAEVALLRWVRLELDQRATARASELLARHAQAFPHGLLAAEAAWLNVQVQRASGHTEAARKAAEQLIESHGATPQARAAREWLGRR